MLANLYLLDDLSIVNFDTLIDDLDSAYGKTIAKLASQVRFLSIVLQNGKSVDKYLADLRHSSIDFGFSDTLDNRHKD